MLYSLTLPVSTIVCNSRQQNVHVCPVWCSRICLEHTCGVTCIDDIVRCECDQTKICQKDCRVWYHRQLRKKKFHDETCNQSRVTLNVNGFLNGCAILFLCAIVLCAIFSELLAVFVVRLYVLYVHHNRLQLVCVGECVFAYVLLFCILVCPFWIFFSWKIQVTFPQEKPAAEAWQPRLIPPICACACCL